MAYRFKRKEDVRDGLRRIAGEQVYRAEAELTDSSLDSADAVHQARKRFKKLRALLRLLRPALDGGTFDGENRCFRDLGRTLAGARDAQVLVETLDGLQRRQDAREADAVLAPIREALVGLRDRAMGSDGRELASRMWAVAESLREAGSRIRGWDLNANGIAAIAPGLQRTYRQGRKAFGKAFDEPADARFHQWRKRSKDHWYHSRLLKNVWPELMTGHAETLKRLADLLGDDHDLAVLRSTGESLSEGDVPAGPLELLADLIHRRQRELRDEAEALGARVYAERPRRFRQRMEYYWNAWRD